MKLLWKPSLFLICLFGLFLLLNFTLKPATPPVTGDTGVPSDLEAQQFIEDHQLLATVRNRKAVPIRFVPYGPAYLLVTGTDSNGEDKAVWLVRDLSTKQVKLIASVLLKEGVSEYAIREKVTPLAPPGTAPLISLAPINLPQFPEERFGWHVTFANDETMILSFKTGERLTGK
ncbi:hypothetical protein CBW65_13280 [Tumebacillus avium]|uniref:DUF5590 domain-containing protein n=1 Tax=Tumebacillus avium TaxID=1903704 RepID=A0A1Y0IPY7_9BACL|nr:hypothetical protein [Tumebacillus avium]ARU61896.1 hypothetical protein CBW65_13280 [Tumebacillus avium]